MVLRNTACLPLPGGHPGRPATRATMEAVRSKLGAVPNLVRTFAVSPAVLNGRLGLDDPAAREIVGHVALNTLNNLIHRVAATAIDFPPTPTPAPTIAA